MAAEEKATRLTISRILRVNHAGEYGAIRIYGAQIALTRRGTDIRGFLDETLGQEKEHLRRFRALMPGRQTQPCGALPWWGVGGAALGVLTAALGRNAVLVCTEAVERTVHRHLDEQLAWLGERDPELSDTIREIQVQEMGHLHHAQDAQTVSGSWTHALDALVAGATEALIWFSTYGASARVARDLKR
jgi:ubiquinone biosynthesis monooxygenase Coq7